MPTTIICNQCSEYLQAMENETYITCHSCNTHLQILEEEHTLSTIIVKERGKNIIAENMNKGHIPLEKPKAIESSKIDSKQQPKTTDNNGSTIENVSIIVDVLGLFGSVLEIFTD